MMKTIGERIRQAREYRGLTGEELALKVGYKKQSGISNLENRATGRGGYALPKIAEVLNFATDWFLNGPDTIDLSTAPPFRRATLQTPNQTESKAELLSEKTANHTDSAVHSDAHKLINEISEAGILKLLPLLEITRESHPRHNISAGYIVPAKISAKG